MFGHATQFAILKMSLIYPKEGQYRMSYEPLSALRKCIRLHDFEGPKKYFWHAAVLLKVFILLGRTIYAGQTLNQPKQLAEIVATYPVRFMAVTKIYMLCFDRNRVNYFYNTVTQEFWDFHIAGPEIEKQIKKRFYVINFAVTCQFIAAMLLVILFLIFPLVEMPEGKRPLPNIIWTPFDTDPSPLYEIIYVVMIWNLALSVLGNAFFDVLFTYSLQHLFVQFMLLKQLIKNITKGIMDDISDIDKYNSNYFQKKVYERFRICSEHHAKLLKFGKNIKMFSSRALLPQLLMSYAVLVINGYILSIDHSDVMKTTGLLNLTGICLVQLAVFSLQGSSIMYQSLSIIDAITDSEWYLFKAPIKKAFAFMIMNSKRALTISAGGMAAVDNEVLLEIVQKAFSAITLLRALTAEAEMKG